MKILGLITEYNPFHNGHKYHLLESIKDTGASHTIIIMSGNFLQRGEPALTNKWIRAEMAIREGADLVIELPFVYSCNSAEFFAYGGISLLNHLNIVDYISFGSEEGNLEKFKTISKILLEEPHLYKKYLKEYLSKGLSYPQARQMALSNLKEENLGSILNHPNNILGIEYMKSLVKLDSPIKPHTIERIKAHYKSTDMKDEICSATAIRNYLFQKDIDPYKLKKVIPEESFKILLKSIAKGLCPVSYSNFEQMIFYHLRKISKDSLKNTMDVNEGLENRIKEAATKAKNIEELLELVKTKRYTYTRLQRILLHSLLGLTKNDIFEFNQWGGPQYARILGFSKNGASLLRKFKKTSQIPILTNINKEKLENPMAKKMIEFDILATDLYSLGYLNTQHRIGSWDYYHRPYSLK